MKQIFICESDKCQPIRVDLSDDLDFRSLVQGNDTILFDRAQCEELVQALSMLVFPGEELEDPGELDED